MNENSGQDTLLDAQNYKQLTMTITN